jgi:hypothetical protein
VGGGVELAARVGEDPFECCAGGGQVVGGEGAVAGQDVEVDLVAAVRVALGEGCLCVGRFGAAAELVELDDV